MIIETERLILRPFLETDATDVYEYLHKPAVNCFASMKLDTLKDAKTEMKKRIGETEYYFAITLKDGDKVIGEINAYPEAGEPNEDKNAQDVYMHIPRIPTYRAGTCARNSECDEKACSWSLSHS